MRMLTYILLIRSWENRRKLLKKRSKLTNSEKEEKKASCTKFHYEKTNEFELPLATNGPKKKPLLDPPRGK